METIRHARREVRALRAIAVAAAVGSACGGCSFMFTEGPPVGHQATQGFDCSSNYVAPVLDTALGGLAIANIAVAASRDGTAPQTADAPSPGAVVGVNLGLLALAASSAYYGYSRVGSCRDAKQALAARSAAGPRDWPGFAAAPQTPALPNPALPPPAIPPAAATGTTTDPALATTPATHTE